MTRAHRALPQQRLPIRLAWLVLAGAWLLPGEAPAQVTEVGLQAAFLYKFTQYAEWPETALGPAGSPVEICVLRREALADVLDAAVSGRRSHDRSLAVRRISQADEVQGCHVLFVGEPGSEGLDHLLATLAGRPTLTVGDGQDFARRGGMIRLAREGRRLQFAINRRAVERAGLGMSSQLLKLASLVDEDGAVAE